MTQEISSGGCEEVRLLQIPDTNLAWLHFFKDGIEKKQLQLPPGQYSILNFMNGIVTLNQLPQKTNDNG